MAAFFSGLWAKLALVAGIIGAIGVFLFRVFRAGGDAERAKSAKAALDHQAGTGAQVRKSDDAVADPKSERAQFVRKKFERED